MGVPFILDFFLFIFNMCLFAKNLFKCFFKVTKVFFFLLEPSFHKLNIRKGKYEANIDRSSYKY